MSADDQTIAALREALKVSPDNLPLRKHLADTLMRMARYDEALVEFKEALSASPGDSGVKLSLAGAYHGTGNNSAAIVILEELIRQPGCPPAAHILYARVLLKAANADQAAREYRKAVTADPSLSDADLAAKLEVEAGSGRDIDQPGESDDPNDEDDRLALPREGQPRDFAVNLERPGISFKDVGGMEALKEEIRMKIIHPLEHPDLYKAYGKPIGGGILMYGPPGCGKTYIARATAGEVKASFMSVGINDVLDMWIGNSERNLHSLFEVARGNTPCVLFFDEVDALGASRADMRYSAGKQLINQFLSEMDGVKNSNDGVLILGATNAPWHLDPAFRRPGRFDRIIFVPPPDRAARGEILRVMLAGKPVEDVDYDALAKKSDHFSGADLKAVVDLAIEAKLKHAIKKGIPTPLATKDLIAAAQRHKATTKEWFSTARNYALYSNQGGIYDDILSWLNIK